MLKKRTTKIVKRTLQYMWKKISRHNELVVKHLRQKGMNPPNLDRDKMVPTSSQTLGSDMNPPNLDQHKMVPPSPRTFGSDMNRSNLYPNKMVPTSSRTVGSYMNPATLEPSEFNQNNDCFRTLSVSNETKSSNDGNRALGSKKRLRKDSTDSIKEEENKKRSTIKERDILVAHLGKLLLEYPSFKFSGVSKTVPKFQVIQIFIYIIIHEVSVRTK